MTLSSKPDGEVAGGVDARRQGEGTRGGVRVAVDVGGTFTDVFAFDDRANQTWIAKVPSTGDSIDGVMTSLSSAGVRVSEMSLFCHGSTIATNALLTRRFGRPMMVTTRGFRDIIEIRRGTREDLWDLFKDPAPPYVPRRDRLEVSERIDYSGSVVQQLDEREAMRVARILRRRGAESVAICFVNSYANPRNEQRMREILGEELPGVPVSASGEVLPEVFEYDRFSTTVINAALAPLVGGYVHRLEGALQEAGYTGDILLLHSGGGVMTPRGALSLPARLAASGLAAGAIAGRHIAESCGFDNAIGLDMGGTSTDISLVHEGEVQTTKEWFVEWGYPICFPSIDVRTIGAGGGSLAWIDEAGSLRNGPESAGADPGPACYSKGNNRPTNTDANLILGRLGDQLLGGAMRLDRNASHAAVAREIAEPLGLGIEAAAKAIIQVANANMADALRLISIRRGYDPRDFVLVVFGGAGPLHGVALARELAIPKVLIPASPGVTSALGGLLVDVRHDLATTFVGRADHVRPAEVEATFKELEAEARDRLAAENVQGHEMRLARAIDMRYVGQWRSLAVPIDAPVTSLEGAVAEFHAAYDREHRYRRTGAEVEIYRLNVRATGMVDKPALPKHQRGRAVDPQPAGTRSVLFDEENQRLETPVFQREKLPAGARLRGPAIVEQLDSTVLVPPAVDAEVDDWLNIQIDVGGNR